MTPLDQAIAAAEAAPEDEAAARGVLAALAGSELYLLLDAEPEEDKITPRLLDVEGGVVLVFDLEERLADFAGPAPYAAMTGRELVGLLQGQGVGVAVNLGAERETILPPDALDWLQEAEVSQEVTGEMPVAVYPPEQLDETLLPQLEARLASAGGLAKQAVLVSAEYSDGRRGNCLILLDALVAAEGDLARYIGDAVAIMGQAGATLDVAFLDASSEAAERVRAVGLAIDLPEPPERPRASDPSKPPRLR